MIAASTQTAQPFPALSAPPLLNADPPTGTHVYLLENSRLGLGAQVPIWEPGFPYANHQNALGLRADVRQTHVRSRCTGKERDGETGLDYFLARYYSSAQGRFTSPDEFPGGIVDPFTGQQVGQPGPLPYADITDPQTLNKYAYVRNNPLRYTDPDGHCGLGDPDGCTLSQWVKSIPDRVVGGLKFEANAALEIFGIAPKFQASNAEQADAMAAGEQIKPEFQQGLVMAIPGPKGVKGSPRTEPTLPPKMIVSKEGVTIQHYTRSGDHGPAHLHVKGQGAETRIGQAGKPLKGEPPLSSTQAQVVGGNKGTIRSSVDKIMRWFRYNRDNREGQGQ